MRSFAILFGSLAVAGLQAQTPAAAPEPNVHYKISRSSDNDENDRAVLGITTQSTGKRDSIGLLIVSVTPNSPADKAGLSEGDRIASINGTSLKLAPSDAGEQDMNGVMTRRLVRQMGEVKPGDDVSLVVNSGGSQKTVKVKTVAADDLSQKREKMGDRAAIGVGFGGGSIRDTLGLFVTNVTSDGPAAKAGIEEGNRIAAINGVDLRVPAAEADEGALVWGKQARLTRVLQGVKPGDVVELRVYADGRFKTVKVTTVKGSELWGENGKGSNFSYSFSGPGMAPMVRMTPMPPMPPMAAMPPMPPMRIRMDAPEAPDEKTMTCVSSTEGQMECTNAQKRTYERAMRTEAKAYEQYGKAYGAAYGRGNSYGGNGDIVIGGLRFTRVSADLASYFGAGSEKGLLVLDASDEWDGIKPGDVLLTVNGRAVQGSDSKRVSINLDSDKDNTFGILRKGKKTTVIVKAH